MKAGKLFGLENTLKGQSSKVLALQETRMTDENIMDFGNYQLFKGKTNKRVLKSTPLLGVALKHPKPCN